MHVPPIHVGSQMSYCQVFHRVNYRTAWHFFSRCMHVQGIMVKAVNSPDIPGNVNSSEAVVE